MKIQSNYSVNPNKKVGFNSRNILLEGTDLIHPNDIIRISKRKPDSNLTRIQYLYPENTEMPISILDPESMVTGMRSRVENFLTSVMRIRETYLKMTNEQIYETLKKARIAEDDFFNLD